MTTNPTPEARRPLIPAALLCALGSLAGCAEAPSPDEGSDDPPARTTAEVTILEPLDGAQVEGPEVRVVMSASGVRIVPAGDTTPGTGHHHVYLNHDVGMATEPVPAIPNEIVHLGSGVSEVVLEDVPPGEHRLIAVVADGVHLPLQPWVVDTVRFTVR